MKNSLTTLALLMTLFALQASAQVSLNVVGYYNVVLYPGDNLIANQLNTTDNTINHLLNYGSGRIADSSTFTKWDPAGNHFQPVSIYDASSDLWTINHSLNLTEGGLLHSPELKTNTFIGEVNQTYFDANSGVFRYGNYPSYANGLYLISCPVPVNGASFLNVVGRAPHDGEWVRILNPATQVYTLTTFNATLGTWDHGAPALNVGQAAWFDLGPVIVPEPSSAALALLAATTLLALARRKSRI